MDVCLIPDGCLDIGEGASVYVWTTMGRGIWCVCVHDVSLWRGDRVIVTIEHEA